MAKRRNGKRRLLDLYADEVAGHVLNQSTRLALEKLAEEFAKESMADPIFRDEMRRIVKESVRKAFGEMTHK